MRFMVIALADGKIEGAVTRTKRQAYDWLKNVQALGNELRAWRYHDGSGWADESDSEAWRLIQSLPARVNVEVYR